MSGSGSQPNSPRLATQENQADTSPSVGNAARNSPPPRPQSVAVHRTEGDVNKEDPLQVENKRLVAGMALLEQRLAAFQQAAVVPIEEANLVVQKREEALAHQAQHEMLEREAKLKQHAEEVFRHAEQEAQLVIEAERQRTRVLEQEGEFRQKHYEQVQRSALEAQASAQAAQENQRMYAAELAHLQAGMASCSQSIRSLDAARMHQSFPVIASLPSQALTQAFPTTSFQAQSMPSSSLPPSFPHLVPPSLAAGQGPYGNGAAFPGLSVIHKPSAQAVVLARISLCSPSHGGSSSTSVRIHDYATRACGLSTGAGKEGGGEFTCVPTGETIGQNQELSLWQQNHQVHCGHQQASTSHFLDIQSGRCRFRGGMV